MSRVVVRRVVGVALALALLAAAFVGARALRHDTASPPPTQYDARTRADFLAACTEGAGAGSEPVCGCAYERLIASVPFSQYLALEASAKQRRSTGTGLPRGTPPGTGPTSGTADTVVPDVLESILVDCVAYNRALGTPPGTGGAPGTPGSRPGTAPPGTLSVAPA